MGFWPSHEESVRLKHIARVLHKNHLGAILTKLGLKRKLHFEDRIKGEHFRKPDLSPEVLLKVFEDLDGSFIKLGQLLSLRPDLIPAEYCDALAKLQDKVEPFSGEDAVKIIEDEFGRPLKKLFKKFDKTPTASASMGQVHLAELKDGTKVAVKVQRPDIEHTIKTDIKLLYRLAKIIRNKYGAGFVDPVEIVREFERYTENEMNYLKEAHNIDLFYHNFMKSKTILVPKVFWNHTKRRVLTMEYIPGKRLTDIDKFKPANRKRIIHNILDAEYEQMFMHGVFHADPHPGNFIIKSDGKIALLDFGIIGRLDYAMREHVTDFFIALVNADSESMVDAAVKLGAANPDTDIDKVRREVSDRLSKYHNVGLDNIKVSDALNDIIHILKENDMKVLPNFVLLTKATITLESVAGRLDPKFNFVENAKPFVKRIARERLHPKRIAERAKKKIETMMDFAGGLPRKTDSIMADLHDTSRDLKRLDGDLRTLTVEIDRSSNRVTLGFLGGTLFIASTILLPFQTFKIWGIPSLSFIGYIIALVVLLAIFVSMIREKRL